MQWLELTVDTASEGVDLLEAMLTLNGYDSLIIDDEADGFDADAAVAAVRAFADGVSADAEATYLVEDEETLATEEVTSTGEELAEAAAVYERYGGEAPDPAVGEG